MSQRGSLGQLRGPKEHEPVRTPIRLSQQPLEVEVGGANAQSQPFGPEILARLARRPSLQRRPKSRILNGSETPDNTVPILL